MWQKQADKLYKEYKFKDFKQAFAFMSEVADVAEKWNHHPKWTNEWNVVQIWLYSHEEGGYTETDESMSKQIDRIYNNIVSPVEKKPNRGDHREIRLFTDGGSRGNPGPSAGGFALLDMENNSLFENGKYLGITTNNQAEYHSLKGGLEAALSYGARVVHVHMDSMLVINQMKGIYKVKNRDLWPIHEAIKALLPKFKEVTFQHVPRELNTLADSIVNKTLDEENPK